MEGCLNVEDLDLMRAAHESDNEWRVRRMFLERHCGDYQKTRLLCLSQIFINITFLGCKYSDGLMAKVREMGAGICEKVNEHRKNFGNGYTKGSTGRRDTMGPPSKVPKRAAETSESIKARNFMLLKAETSLMENGVDALQSLNRAVSRVKVTWELKEVSASGEIALSVDDVVILKSIFPGGKTPTVKQYAAAATLAAISSDNVEIRNISGNLELWRGNVGPGECYSDYVIAKLHKAAALLPKGGSAYARLEKALQSANIPLQFIAEQGTGWEERIALQVLNVELASAVLRKSECAKGRELQRKEELAASVISSISSPLLKLVASDKGFTIVS
uniref:XRN2-binding (XTBD) domain-containing protein n=1 Tax=Ascaris lumbricoides TaxID=6252 RepID=A0A0M3HW07_ASCLU